MDRMISVPTSGNFTINVTHHHIEPRYSQAVELNMQVHTWNTLPYHTRIVLFEKKSISLRCFCIS